MTKEELLRKGYKLTMVNSEGLLQSIVIINNDTVKYHNEEVKRSIAVNDALSRMHSIDNKVAVNGAKDLYALLFGDSVIGKEEDELEVLTPKYNTDEQPKTPSEPILEAAVEENKEVEEFTEKLENSINEVENKPKKLFGLFGNKNKEDKKEEDIPQPLENTLKEERTMLSEEANEVNYQEDVVNNNIDVQVVNSTAETYINDKQDETIVLPTIEDKPFDMSAFSLDEPEQNVEPLPVEEKQEKTEEAEEDNNNLFDFN